MAVTTPHTLHQSDGGASALIVAISIFVLMGFSALVIDIGAGFNDRAQDQSAADSATLGTALELMISEDANPFQAAVDQAKALVDATLQTSIPTTDWVNCTDLGSLAFPSDTIPGVTDGSQCISFGPSEEGIEFAKVRVRVPDQYLATTFGRVIGFTSLNTSAVAESTMLGSGASGAFPAAVFSGAGAGDNFCIKTGTGSSNHESCGDPSTGDFGNFQPYFYSEISPGNPTSRCTSGNQVDPLSRAMANGIDHFLGFTASVPGVRENGSQCPQFPGPPFPDRVDSGSGYSNTDITQGLITGGSFDGSFDGRLTKKIWSAPYGSATVFGHDIDNRPLWSYLNTDVTDSLPAGHACRKAAGEPFNRTPVKSSDFPNQAAFNNAQKEMLDCLTGPPAPPQNLFTEDIYDTPRLTVVPKYHQSAPIGNNSCCYDIKDFVPIFIEGIWTKNGPQWSCSGNIESAPGDYCKHEPGLEGSISIGASGQRKVDSASGIVLSCELLPGDDPPEERCKRIQNSDGDLVNVFINLELTR